VVLAVGPGGDLGVLGRHGDPADLGIGRAADVAAERDGQGLAAEAQAEDRHAGVRGGAQGLDLLGDPGGLGVGGGVLRAERRDPGRPGQVGHALLPHPHDAVGEAGLGEVGAEVAGRRVRAVLEDDAGR
jgi:hypothetical protein